MGASDDLAAAQTGLAREFATVALPDTGKSVYGYGETKPLISAQETAQALQQERQSYRDMIAAGKSPDEAWNALSPALQ